MTRSWILAGALAGLAAAAIGHGLSGGSPGGETAARVGHADPGRGLDGADVPLPGALRGTITFATESGCGAIDLRSVTLEDATGSRVCASLGFRELLVRSPRDLPAVLLGGRVVLTGAELERGLDSRSAGALRVLGQDERVDGLAAVVVTRLARGHLDNPGARRGEGGASFLAAVAVSADGIQPELVLELWRGARLEAATALPTLGYPTGAGSFGTVVRFSPDGKEVAVAAAGSSAPLVLLHVPSLETRLGPTAQDAFAWSPDGAWFALATSRGIALSGSVRSEPAYLLPVRAAAISWL